MSYTIDIKDPDTDEWITKAEGETARALIEALRDDVVDLHALVEYEGNAVIDQTGEIVRLVSPLDEPGDQGLQDGHRVVPAMVTMTPPAAAPAS
jgi:hypothetical protein